MTTPAVVIRPIWLVSNSVNHRLPSGPPVMPEDAARRGQRELGDRPVGRDPADLVAAVLGEPELAVGSRRDPRIGFAVGDRELGRSRRTGVIRPILLLPYSVNQRLPSEPAAIAIGLLAAGIG